MPDQAHVASLHRFPVKSMLGERLPSLDVEERGSVGDRRWSVRTAAGKIGSGKSTRRFSAVEGLLLARAEERDGAVLVTFPDGSTCAVPGDEAAERLSRLVGRPVTFARETTVSHFDDGPAAFAEEEWLGRRLRIGTAVLLVTAPSPRCVMVNAETADLPAQPGNLAAIGRLRDGKLGVVATVVRPGRISEGDAVTLE